VTTTSPSPSSGQSSAPLPTIKAVANNILVTIVPNDTGALVSFDTNSIVYAQIFWGTDTNYGSGTLVEKVPTDSHHFIIQNLKPSTKYYLKIVLTSQLGRTNSYENIQFVTTSSSIVALPSNVTRFSATPNKTAITLDWKLPLDPTLVGVRIVRSTQFYPSTPKDGQVIFDDSTAQGVESFVDQNVSIGVTYFYTIFTKDIAGNFSSGAIDSARILKPGEPVATSTPLENIPESNDVDPQINKLTLNDFLFIQDGDSLPIKNDLVTINGEKNLTLALKSFHLPEVLKTVAVTLLTTDETPKSFTFILRPNADKTRFESTIGSLGTTSIYRLKISVIDYKNQGLRKLKGTLYVKNTAESYASATSAKYLWYLLGLIVLALLILALRQFKKKHV